MVFLTAIRAIRVPSPDQFWKRRRVLRLTAHLYGRRRNCYSIAIRALHHTLEDSSNSRKLKKEDMRELWDTRINGATEEHGIPGIKFKEALHRCKIFLNRKVLADLAIWEPRTFKALTDVAKRKAVYESDLNYDGKDKQDLSHVSSKGLLQHL